MKKRLLPVCILFVGMTPPVFASAGYAKDGLEFLLFLAGFLLIVAAMLSGIDYLSRNGRELISRAHSFLKRAIPRFTGKLHSSGLNQGIC